MLSQHRCSARRVLALILLCWAATAHAQPRLTAQEAVRLAWAQPHVLNELDASVDLARSEVVAARTWSNPTLSMDREQLRDAAMPGRESSVMLTQPFELGGQRGLRIRAAQAGVIAAEAGVAHERTRMRADVLRDYYAAVAAGRRMQAQEKISAGLASLADVAGKRQRAGDLSGYESRRIAQASAQAQARHAEASAEERGARTRLAGWIGAIALDAVLDDGIQLAAAASGGADLRSTELDALTAQRAHAEAQAAAASRVALPFTVGIGSKRVREGGMRDQAVMLEVGVDLPLFDRNQGERARTSAELRRLEAQYQRTLAQTRARRSAAEEEARQLTQSARHMQAMLVPEAAQLTAIARASFAEGELDLVGLLDAYDAEAAVIDHTLEQQARALEALLEVERLSAPATMSPNQQP